MQIYRILVDQLFRSYAYNQKFEQRVQEIFKGRSVPSPMLPSFNANPYSGNSASSNGATSLKEKDRPALFITARFRSGSTLLWHLYANLPGVTAFYEPLHEVRWFMLDEPGGVDPTHIGVKDYRLGYEGMKDLADCFDVDWGRKRLWMDGTSFDWKLKRYVGSLVTRAKGFPVLQFNRVDFRLQWLRANFPHCPILHLIRNPRDQWMSVLFKQKVDPRVSIAEFGAYDRFALGDWVADLKLVFPCLDLPSNLPAYQLHYLVWRLSQIYGESFADMTIKYEELASDPVGTLRAVGANLGIDALKDRDYSGLKNLAVVESKYSTDEFGSWYAKNETQCEEYLRIMMNGKH